MSTTESPEPLSPWDEHNEVLWNHTHPPDWVNPTPDGRYNLVVIGAGTAGLVAAIGAAGLGAKVALVERHMTGGDCLNTGCVPSKALIRSAHAAAEVRDAGRFGVEVGEEFPTVNFPQVMERMRRLRAEMSGHDSAARFRDAGIDVFLGQGEFSGPDRISVDGQDLRFKKAVIATGARASVPTIPGLAEAGFLTHETIFSLTELPKRLGVIGAGPIGCELAQSFARFGSEVHLMELADRILPREETDASDLVRASLERDGVRLHIGHKITEVHVGESKTLILHGAGDTQEVQVDAILVAVGRVPNVHGMGLETAGVAFDKASVQVDDFLQTTNPMIYACGDVAQKHHFTHTADFSARIVIRNALFMGKQRLSALTVPWATFTDPGVAHVGLTVADAKERGVELRTFHQPMAGVDRAILDGETEGYVRIHVAGNSDRILGATIVGKRAGDLISEVSVAMAGGLGLGALANVIHPYPTHSEGVWKAAGMYNRTRLTPLVAGAMGRWLSFTR